LLLLLLLKVNGWNTTVNGGGEGEEEEEVREGCSSARLKRGGEGGEGVRGGSAVVWMQMYQRKKTHQYMSRNK
jgi:hypothetical protein